MHIVDKLSIINGCRCAVYAFKINWIQIFYFAQNSILALLFMDIVEGIVWIRELNENFDEKIYKRKEIPTLIWFCWIILTLISLLFFILWITKKKPMLIFLDLILNIEYVFCIERWIVVSKHVCFVSFSFPIDNVNCSDPRLVISPSQTPLRLPVGNQKMITCQGKVDNNDLISDLRWTNAEGLQIQPKT